VPNPYPRSGRWPIWREAPIQAGKRPLVTFRDIGRRGEPAVRMPPPHERLDAGVATRAQRDDGLVVEQELVRRDRALQLRGQRHTRRTMGVERGRVDHRAAARFLRSVQGDVGTLKERALGVAVLREKADADARGDTDGMAVEVDRRDERAADAIGDSKRIRRACVQHDRELVAAQARRSLVDRQCRTDPGRDRAQQEIAEPVAERVVHILEVVEIDEQHGDRPARVGRRVQCVFDAPREEVSVR